MTNIASGMSAGSIIAGTALLASMAMKRAKNRSSTIQHPAQVDPAPTEPEALAEMQQHPIPAHVVENPVHKNWRPAPIVTPATTRTAKTLHALSPILAPAGHSATATVWVRSGSAVPKAPEGCELGPAIPAPANCEAGVAVDCASIDPYGLTTSSEAVRVSHSTIERYGLGSCGPRGFYGSSGEHIAIEHELASWYGSEVATVYSSGYACTASIVGAFLKKPDFAIFEAGCSAAVQTGLSIAKCQRAIVPPGNIAAMQKAMAAHVEEHEAAVAAWRALPRAERRSKACPAIPTRFVVIDSVHPSTGHTAQVSAIAQLCRQYKFRMMVDETATLGLCGPSGRGLCAREGLKLGLTIPLITAGLGAAFGSLGGVCFSCAQLGQHQETSSLAYCFSAAAPPYTAAALRANLKDIANDEWRNAAVAGIARRTRALRDGLRAAADIRTAGIYADEFGNVTVNFYGAGDDAPAAAVPLPGVLSAVKEAQKICAESTFSASAQSAAVYTLLRAQLLKHGVLASSATAPMQVPGMAPPAPALRFHISVHHTDAHITAVTKGFAAFVEELRADSGRDSLPLAPECLPTSYELLGNPVPATELPPVSPAEVKSEVVHDRKE